MNLQCWAAITQNTSSGDRAASHLPGSLAVMHGVQKTEKNLGAALPAALAKC